MKAREAELAALDERITEARRTEEAAQAKIKEREADLAERERSCSKREETVGELHDQLRTRTDKASELEVVLRTALARVSDHERSSALERRTLARGLKRLDRSIRHDLDLVSEATDDPAIRDVIQAIREANSRFVEAAQGSLGLSIVDVSVTPINVEQALDIKIDAIGSACEALVKAAQSPAAQMTSAYGRP